MLICFLKIKSLNGLFLIANFDTSFVQWKTFQHLPDIDP